MKSSNFTFRRAMAETLGSLSSSKDGVEYLPLKIKKNIRTGSVANHMDGVETGVFNTSNKQTPNAPNPYRSQDCYLPPDHTFFKLEYTLQVYNFIMNPHTCSNRQGYKQLVRASRMYSDLDGFKFLSRLYWWNILNCRTLWRNNFNIMGTKVKIVDQEQNDKTMLNYDLFSNPLSLDHCDLDGTDPAIRPLIDRMAAAMNGDSGPLRVGVIITGKMVPGCQVYPSQAYIEDNKDSNGYNKGKVLLTDCYGNAVLSAEKIGVARRFIDDWYPEATTVIPAETFGFDQPNLRCHRLYIAGEEPDEEEEPVGDNFYRLLDRLDTDILDPLQSATSVDDLPNEVHYFFGVLSRGGLFANMTKAEREKAKSSRKSETGGDGATKKAKTGVNKKGKANEKIAATTEV